MLSKISKIWQEYGFEILLIISVIFILIFALFRIGKKGTWSKTYLYNSNLNSPKSKVNQKSSKKTSKGEQECRRVLEKYFNKSFPSCRPDFLRNPVTGGKFNLELDCYNNDLKLAVEYNGAQHYKYIPYFHKNKEAFLNQKYRDDMKRRICKEHRIILIEVPNTVPLKNIELFLLKQLKSKGFFN